MIKKKTIKRKRNPNISIEYLKDLIGRKVILLVNHGMAIETLQFRDPWYKLTHSMGKESVLSFNFKEEDIKSIEIEGDGQCYIDLRK